MADSDWLAGAFEEHREHLRAVAYRLLGSMSDADDAVQDTWLRLTGTDASDVENIGGRVQGADGASEWRKAPLPRLVAGCRVRRALAGLEWGADDAEMTECGRRPTLSSG